MRDSLHRAVRYYDVNRVASILSRDPSCVNDWNSDFFTPLLVAYKYFDNSVSINKLIVITRLLINYGADVNAQSGIFLETPLQLAVALNEVELVNELLINGANPNLRGLDDKTALHYASMVWVNINIIKLLLLYGANPNAVNDREESLLAKAGEVCRLDIVEVLRQAGARMYKINHVLLNAGLHRRADVMRYFIRNGAKLEARSEFVLKSVYFNLWNNSIINKNDIDFIDQCLLEEGVDVDELKNGSLEMTHLHAAVGEGNEETVEYLLKAGENVNAKNLYGDTPLHYLLIKPWTDVAKMERIGMKLVQYGADLDARNYNSYTVFHLAAKKGSLALINVILAQRTGVFESTDDESVKELYEWIDDSFESGYTLHELAIAVILGYKETVGRLIDVGCFVQWGNDNLKVIKSPLYFAVETDQHEIVKTLLDAGLRSEWNSPGMTPAIDAEMFEQRDLELLCMLWEFKCIPIIRKTLSCVLNRIIKGSEPSELSNLVIFYYAVELRFNRLSKELIPMKGVFKMNEQLTMTLACCNSKLNNLKKENVCGSRISKYKILSMELDLVVKFLNNEENFNVLNNLTEIIEKKAQLDYDDYVLAIRIKLAMERRRLLDITKDYLTEFLQKILRKMNLISIPDEMIWSILAHLNVRELNNCCDKFSDIQAKGSFKKKNVIYQNNNYY